MKTAVNILIGIILLTIALSLILVYVNTHPPRYPLHIPPSTYRVDYEPLSFKTEDGIILKGWLIKPPHPEVKSPAIIICHGVGANKSDFTELAAYLSRRGYYVLLFDFRAHGESGGSRTSLGYHEQKDIAAALSSLQSRPPIDRKRAGIYGFSMGGPPPSSRRRNREPSPLLPRTAPSRACATRRTTRLPASTGCRPFPFVPLTVLGYELFFRRGFRTFPRCR